MEKLVVLRKLKVENVMVAPKQMHGEIYKAHSRIRCRASGCHDEIFHTNPFKVFGTDFLVLSRQKDHSI